MNHKNKTFKNLFLSSSKIIRASSFVFIAAALIVGGFFVADFALAAHTATVNYTIDGVATDRVKGNNINTYEFTITNAGPDGIVHVKIEQANFTNFTNLSCPFEWVANTGGGAFAECSWVFGKPKLTTTGIISFRATSPLVSNTYQWTITTDDLNEGQNILTSQIEVDATPPTILSITTKDSNGDGKVDTATIVFSEPVNDLSFSASNFTIGGGGTTGINTGAPNDNTFDVVLPPEGIQGTEAKDVTYTQGAGADLVGNLLANVLPETITEIDGAAPILVSVRTTSITTIDLTFSEDLNGSTVTNADFSVADFVLDSNNDAYEVSSGVVRLTTTNPFGTGETPAVTYNTTESNGVKDLADNQAPAAGPITPTDGVSPIIASARTISTTEIQVTFSEPISAVLAGDFAVADNTVPSVIFTSGTTATLILGAPIGTGATPNVSTIGTPTGTKDSADNLIVGSLSLTPEDGILPVVSNATASPDPAKAGEVTITVVFSENMDTGVSPTVQITGIIGSPIDVTQSSYTDNTWTGTFTLSDNNEEKTATIIVAEAVDAVGNVMEEDTTAGIFEVDTVEPLAPNVTLPAIINISNVGSVSMDITGEVGTDYNYTIEDTTPGSPVSGNGTLTDGNVTLSVNLSSLDDGTINVTVTLTDAAGNVSASGTDTATKDTVAPIISSITSDATGVSWLKVGDTITFTLTPSDPEPGAEVVGSYNGQTLVWTTADSGVTFTAIYTVNEGDLDQVIPLQIIGVVITDAVGNSSTPGSGSDIAKTIDANTPLAPTIALIDPVNIANETAITITGSGEADTTVDYSIDDEDAETVAVSGEGTVDSSENISIANIDVSSLSDGTLTLSVTLTDEAGNTSVPGTDTATKDTVAPVIDITFPLVGDVVNGDAVVIFDDSESTSPQCSIDDSVWVGCTSGVTILSAITGFTNLAQGTFNLYLKDTDTAGNTGTDSETGIIKDTINPSIDSFTSPVVDTVYKVGIGGVPLTFTASDASSISCSYTVDSGTFDVDCLGGTIPDKNLSDGRDEVVITVTDAAGNSNESDPISFVFDEDDTLDVPADFTTIQGAIDAAVDDDTIIVAAGTYNAFQVVEKNNIRIISEQGATVTTAIEIEIEGEGVSIMALVANSEDIIINGINFDGAGVVNKNQVRGIVYVNSTGSIADLTVNNINGNEIAIGIAAVSDEEPSTTIVDFSDITVSNSMMGVAIRNAEVGLANCTITGSQDGIGIMAFDGAVVNIEDCLINNFWVVDPEPGTAGLGIMIGVPAEDEVDLDIIGEERNSVVDMTFSTIAGNNIGIYVDEDGSLEANSNEIVNNDVFGILNDENATEAVGATENYWGTAVAATIESMVEGLVNFTPYYVDEGMTILSNEPVSTVYVDDGYEDGLPNDSHYFGYDAFATIQEGIDAVVDGGTVSVADGIYTEDITIETDDLTLEGAQAGIDARDRTADESEVIGSIEVTDAVDTVAIDGFKITVTVVSPWSNTALVVDSSSATIQNNIVHGVTTTGPFTRSGIVDFDALQEATISQNDLVLHLHEPSGQNGFRFGVVSGAGTITIADNRVENAAGGGVGIMSDATTAVINVENNELFNGGDGVWVWNPTASTFDTITVSGNEIHNNSAIGVKSAGSFTGAIDIEENDIHDNETGIQTDQASGMTIRHNQIYDNESIDTGVKNNDSETLDAEENWWGDATGPEHGSNPGGIGDAVSDNVDFRPWYTNAGLTDLDEAAPTVIISSTETSPTNVSLIPIIITFSESVLDFTADDITVNNGDKGALGGSGSTYTIDITPTDDGAVTVDIAAEVAWDLSGNYNTVADQFSITFDGTEPTLDPVSIESNNTNDTSLAKVGDTIILTFIADEDIQTPTVTIAGETAIVSDGPTTWSAEYTMTGIETEGAVSFAIEFADVAGNNGTPVTDTTDGTSVEFDKTAPAGYSVSINQDYINDSNKTALSFTFADAEVDVTYNYSIDDTNGGTAAVTDNGTITTADQQITGIDVSALDDDTLTLTVYLTDPAGNQGTDATDTVVKDVITPTVESHVPTVNAVNVEPANDIVVTFSEAVIVETADVSFNPVFTDFTIQNSETNVVSIRPTNPLESNTSYTVTLSGVTDLAGNVMASYDNINFTTATYYNISLYFTATGWNLISLPVVPNETAIGTVLGNTSSSIEEVWTYAPNHPNADDSGWLMYAPGDPAETNNLDVMTTGYGYWISVTGNTNIEGWGSLLTPGPITPPSRTLNSGWNLIGYYQIPGEDSSTPAKAFASLQSGYTSLWGYDNAGGVFKSTVITILPGDGFWISLTGNKEYTPSNL